MRLAGKRPSDHEIVRHHWSASKKMSKSIYYYLIAKVPSEWLK